MLEEKLEEYPEGLLSGLQVQCMECGNFFLKERRKKCPWCGEVIENDKREEEK